MIRTFQGFACLVVGAVALAGCNAGTQDANPAQASAAPAATEAMLAAPVEPNDACYSVEGLGPVWFEKQDYQALGINVQGTVVGATLRWTGDRSAFIYKKGSLSDLGNLGGGFGDARAINAWGLAVGGSRDAAENYRAVSFYKGKVTDLGTLDGTNSFAVDVNNLGLAVGSATVSGTNHAAAFFLRHVFDLGVLGGETYANGVNDLGEIVGTGRLADGTWRGFLFRGGKMLELGTIGGVPGTSDAVKINNRGTVCGSAEAPNAYHGFLYRDGKMTELGDLGAPGQYGVSICSDISETGMAVGLSNDSNGYSYAVLWTNPLEHPGGLIDLHTRISPDLAFYLRFFWASGINSAGQITVYGFNGVSFQGIEGYLLSPVKCPAS
jgi:probable HAF family extracellular repeat protein